MQMEFLKMDSLQQIEAAKTLKEQEENKKRLNNLFSLFLILFQFFYLLLLDF
jgi:hypothetical protein